MISSSKLLIEQKHSDFTKAVAISMRGVMFLVGNVELKHAVVA